MNRTIKKRIAGLLERADSDTIEHGKQWYNDAHDEARRLAEKFALSVDQTRAIIAILSPGTRWEINLDNAARLIVERERASVSTYGTNKRKALKVLDGESPLSTRPKWYGRKVHSFYTNISNPAISRYVTIDRWIIRALLSKRVNANQVFGTKLYERVQACIKAEADKRGFLAHELQAILWRQIKRESEGF